MEDVPTAQLRASLSTQLLSETDRAELVLVDTIVESIVLGALFVEARQALALILDTLACVATLERLTAHRHNRFFFLHLGVASVDQNLFRFFFLVVLDVILFGKDKVELTDLDLNLF